MKPLSTLYRGGPIYSPADPTATALLVRGDTIDWLGRPAEAPAADRVVDLAGALVTPAFVDAHVHTTATGLTLGGLDLTGARSAEEVLDAVAGYAAGLPCDAVVLGHGWDESGWPRRHPPTAEELDRAAAGRMVYLSQACIHSAACSAALLAAAPGASSAPGYHCSGWLRRDAHHAVREVALASVSAAQRSGAQRAALRHAASLGIAAVHECGGPGTSDEADFTAVLALSPAGGAKGTAPGTAPGSAAGGAAGAAVAGAGGGGRRVRRGQRPAGGVRLLG